MTLTLNIPEQLLRRLETVCDDVPRAVLEGFAAEAYRSGKLSRAEIAELLQYPTSWETENFLSEHDAWPSPTLDEVTMDIGNLRKLRLP